MKLLKQTAVLAAVIISFVSFDIAVYNAFTSRYIDRSSKGMKADSVELDKYLPFDPNSKIVRCDTDFQLEGDLPVIDGAAALYPMFSAFVSAVYPPESVDFDGSCFTEKSALQYTNTRGAYASLADGKADIIFCAEPSDEQRQYAAEKGADLVLTPIGCEAFVFLVNENNPVDNLSTEQIKGIYSGEYSNWSQLGGRDIPIDVLLRNKGSGSQTAMEKFMGSSSLKKPFNGLRGSAIGFSFRYYVTGISENSGVKMLALDGIYPDKENIADGSYPITGSIYAVYDRNNDNKNIQPFISWILSDEGQEIVEKSGYVPLEKE